MIRRARAVAARIVAACIAAAFIAAASAPKGLAAQISDTLLSRELAPGVSYRQFTDRSGPFVMHLVRVNLRRGGVEIRHARANDQLRGRERTSAMARRASESGATVLAAINADFFSLATGENENNQVIGGEWWKGLKVTDSPFDTYDNPHMQFAVDAAGRPQMDRYVFDGKAVARGVATPITTLNFNPSGNPEGTALYTFRYGPTTPRDTTRLSAEAALVHAGRRGDTLLYLRRGPVAPASGSAIPADGAVLSAYGNGSRIREVTAMADGDTVRVLLSTLPRMARGPTLIIGGQEILFSMHCPFRWHNHHSMPAVFHLSGGQVFRHPPYHR